MHFTSGCNHPSFTLPWRTLLPYLMALHLLQPGSAQQRVVAPSLRVTAIVGQDVVLRCQLSPCKDAWRSDIRWIQLRSSRLVHHYQYGLDLGQMEEYKGRTELLRKGLSDGNLDLRITAVSTSDNGSYSCAVQDDDGYGDAVVELEVSDPFSQIVHPWKVALAVVVTILVGSFVINVFLYRKKAAQSRELKRKDAMLGPGAEKLKKLASKLNENADEVEKDCDEMSSAVADLKKLAAELEKHPAVIWIWDLKLYNLAAKLGQQTKELEEQHSQFQGHFQHMDLSAVKQKKLVTKLEEHCNQMVRRNVKLEAAAVKLGQQAKESEEQKSELKERHEEMEQTEAVVVDTELRLAISTGVKLHTSITAQHTIPQ